MEIQMAKRFNFDKNESQKGYLDDFKSNTTENAPVKKEKMIRKSFLISKNKDEKIEQFVIKKRMSGDVYYSQTDLFNASLDIFFKNNQ